MSRLLHRFLDAKNSLGLPKYSQRALRDCLALLLLSTEEIEVQGLSEPLQRMLGQFALEIGFVGPGATADKLEPLVDAYFDEHPLDIGLLEKMRAAVRQGLDAQEFTLHRALVN